MSAWTGVEYVCKTVCVCKKIISASKRPCVKASWCTSSHLPILMYSHFPNFPSSHLSSLFTFPVFLVFFPFPVPKSYPLFYHFFAAAIFRAAWQTSFSLSGQPSSSFAILYRVSAWTILDVLKGRCHWKNARVFCTWGFQSHSASDLIHNGPYPDHASFAKVTFQTP